jgi:hypothetical protein
MILPVATREIRVAAHSAGTYRGRLIVCCGGILINLWAIIALNLSRLSPHFLGEWLFTIEGWLLFLLALLAGFFGPADSLSSEKRQGTLGLLFLTQLKGRDVVFGKLAATTLRSFCGILALLPILAVPILIGGIQFSQCLWLLLSVTNVLLVGASVGLFASSICWQEMRARSISTLLMLGLVGGTSLLAYVLRHLGVNSSLSLAIDLISPLYLQRTLFGAIVGVEGVWCIVSALVVFLIACCFLLLACRAAPRHWQIAAKPSIAARLANRLNQVFSSIQSRTPLGRRLLDSNPYLWLATRNRMASATAWAFIAVTLAGYCILSFVFSLYWEGNIVLLTFGIPTLFWLQIGLKVRVGGNATRHICEAKESGTLQLIMASDLALEEIIRGQFQSAKRLFGRQLLAVIPIFIITYFLVRPGLDKLAEALTTPPDIGLFRLRAIEVLAGSLFFLFFDAWSITWIGLYTAFRSPDLMRARMWAGFWILPFPWFAFVLSLMGLYKLRLLQPGYQPGPVAAIYLAVALTCNLIMVTRARRWLFHHARSSAALPIDSARDESIIPARFKPVRLGRILGLPQIG